MKPPAPTEPEPERRLDEALIRSLHALLLEASVSGAAARLGIAQPALSRHLRALRRLTGAPEHLRIVHLPRMVHSKVVVIDHRVVDIGSANFTRISHGVYEEINLYADHARFAQAIEREIARHAQEGVVVDEKLRYRRLASGLERAVMAYQSRKGG